jgi:hypothetical protein
MCLEGTITIKTACGVPKRVAIRVELPDDYPDSEPRAYDAAGRWPHIADRHFFPDGRCCLWLDVESRWRPEDPDRLLCFLTEVALFFHRQFVYDVTGKWPGEARSHGEIAYVEWVLDELGGDRQLLAALAPVFAGYSVPGRKSPCPCGSGRRYKRCHADTVDAITGRCGQRRLAAIFIRFLADAARSQSRR